MSLELAAMRWLWLEQNCLVVLEQRSPLYGMGLPDVIGVTRGRYLTEIEIKRSYTDFRQDFEKTHRKYQSLGMMPQRQFYYLVPAKLSERILPEIPEWAGLMRQGDYPSSVEVIKKAPVNKAARKLGIHSCARLARQMTNHMMGYALANASIREQWRNNESFYFADWVPAEKGTYQI